MVPMAHHWNPVYCWKIQTFAHSFLANRHANCGHHSYSIALTSIRSHCDRSIVLQMVNNVLFCFSSPNQFSADSRHRLVDAGERLVASMRVDTVRKFDQVAATYHYVNHMGYGSTKWICEEKFRTKFHVLIGIMMLRRRFICGGGSRRKIETCFSALADIRTVVCAQETFSLIARPLKSY